LEKKTEIAFYTSSLHSPIDNCTNGGVAGPSPLERGASKHAEARGKAFPYQRRNMLNPRIPTDPTEFCGQNSQQYLPQPPPSARIKTSSVSTL